MPLYEYRCRECGHRFEILQRIGEGAQGLTCPHCGAPGIEKQFSTFASHNASETRGAVAGSCGPGGFG